MPSLLRSSCAVLVLLAATACHTAGEDAHGAAPDARLLELSRRDNRVMQHLQHLCKEIGPRLTGSTDYDRAAQWCLESLRGWGLDARLEKWGEFPVRFDRGVQKGRQLRPEERPLSFLTRAWSRGTQGARRAPAVLEPRDQADLDARAEQFAGAWIVRRAARSDEKLAAALATAQPAGFVRASRGELLVMSGNHRIEYGELDQKLKQVEITLLKEQHASIVAQLERGEAVELEFEIENRFAPGPVACTNVVADIEGREFPDEYVIVGAHLDSWDGSEGAQDNATGVASALEAARLIASLGIAPRRTIRFVLFGGEEQGLFGSQGYVKTHARELGRISAVFVHDGGQNPLQGVQATYPMLIDLEQVLGPLAGLDPARAVRVEETIGLENSGDSDHAPFLAQEAGVPAFFWDQSLEGYDRVHHTQFDTLDTIVAADQEHNARVVAIAAWGLAELDHLLDRTDMSPLPRRRLLVGDLEGTTVRRVLEGGHAEKAGWQDGDVVLAIDGTAVAERADIVRLVNLGGPRKLARLRRGQAELDTTLDWSDEKDEVERSARAGRREAWRKAHGGR